MSDHIAGGRTILFAPTVPAGVGLDHIVGSIARTAEVDIVVGANGAVMKDRHGDANKVLASLAADTDKRLTAEELEWSDVLIAATSYAFGQYVTWLASRRAMRKADAPDWAVKLAGRLTLLITAPQNQKAAGFDKEMMERAGQKVTPILLPKLIALGERWDRWKAKRSD
jgi:hypothetical protein